MGVSDTLRLPSVNPYATGMWVASASVRTNRVPSPMLAGSTARLNVNFSHYDFGSATGEAFTTDTNTTWGVPQIAKGENINDFLLWANVSDTDATVTVTFHFQNADTFVFTANTESFRRGGLSIDDIPQLPDGEFSAVVTSPGASAPRSSDGTAGSADSADGWSGC